MKAQYGYQIRALHRWEFEYNEKERTYHLDGYELKVCWSIEKQSGAYFLDGDLMFINNWEMLDDIMSQMEIY